MRKSSMSAIFSNFTSRAVKSLANKAFAESTISTAGTSVNGGSPFTAWVRMVYSKEIESKALPNMRFLQFAKVQNELGVTPGLTITMLTYDNLKRGGALEENVDMTTQAMSGSTKQITVTEFGNAVAVTEKLVQSSFEDVMADATLLLSRDYALVMDTELRDTALNNSTNIVYGGRKSGRDELTSNDGLSVAVIKDAVEILSTADAPKYNGNSWICFVHPHQSRVLRDDPAWINASNYGAPIQLFNGEIGRIDDVRFIETTLMCNGAVDAKSPSYDKTLVKGYKDTEDPEAVENAVDIYQALLFGDAYYGLAVSLPVELRDNGVQDFGRKRELAWYSIFGTGILHEQYGVLIETA